MAGLLGIRFLPWTNKVSTYRKALLKPAIKPNGIPIGSKIKLATQSYHVLFERKAIASEGYFQAS